MPPVTRQVHQKCRQQQLPSQVPAVDRPAQLKKETADPRGHLAGHLLVHLHDQEHRRRRGFPVPGNGRSGRYQKRPGDGIFIVFGFENESVHPTESGPGTVNQAAVRLKVQGTVVRFLGDGLAEVAGLRRLGRHGPELADEPRAEQYARRIHQHRQREGINQIQRGVLAPGFLTARRWP